MKKINLYKETTKIREERISASRKTYTKIIKPKKGKGSYSRKSI
jgi:stalled ribosome alternative rescue factor ArfA